MFYTPPSATVLLTWRDGHLTRTPLPDVGATTEIAWEPGPVEQDPEHRHARRKPPS
jgi:hypothetical protein